MNDLYKELFERAVKAAENSYSPYSRFKVGAALLCSDGTIYTGCNYTITITCPIHGDFQQKAGAHLYGQGCSQCAHLISAQELELREFLGTIYENEMIFNSRAFIKPKELDIYLPDIKTAFEYNGNYWHALYEENDPGYHDCLLYTSDAADEL